MVFVVVMVFREEAMSSTQERIQVFQDTLKWINTDPTLKEAVEDTMRHTFVFYEDYYPEFDITRHKKTSITISDKRSFQAAVDLHVKDSSRKIAVMNFANAFQPGGGVVDGASAQEECLCRTSTLYPSIQWEQLRNTFYAHHHEMGTPTASDSLIYSEGIIVCKTDEDIPKRLPKEDWIKVDVITIAAPDQRTGVLYTNDAALFGYHVKRAIHMLTCAAAKNADVLVLGAFGCGAFQNNPEVVANAYRIALDVFPNFFDQVEFAIYSPQGKERNYKVFEHILLN
jgi:uncharacterized protein (TIGR02452 family)